MLFRSASLTGGGEEDGDMAESPDMAAENAAAESQIPEGFYPVAVEIGLSDANNTEIVSGLEEGTPIYVTTYTNNDGYYGSW